MLCPLFLLLAAFSQKQYHQPIGDIRKISKPLLQLIEQRAVSQRDGRARAHGVAGAEVLHLVDELGIRTYEIILKRNRQKKIVRNQKDLPPNEDVAED